MQKEFNLLHQDSQASDNFGTNRTLYRKFPERAADEESKQPLENKEGITGVDFVTVASPNVECVKYGSLMSSYKIENVVNANMTIQAS